MKTYRQHGMAVIVALLVVAIVSVIATLLITRQAASLRALRSEQLRAQVRLSVDAAIAQASLQLREDARERLTTVNSGRWSQPLHLQAPLPLQARVADAQGMFNLRNLLKDGSVDAEATRAFMALCRAQGIADGQCGMALGYLQARLRDGGWEAKAPLPREDVLQLAMPAADPAALRALAQRTVMLPARTLLNANTCDIDTLRAVADGLEPGRLQALLDQRDQGRWLMNRGDIANRLQLTNAQMTALPLGIHSEWFVVVGQVQADAAMVDFRALLWREYRDKGVRVQRVWTRIGA